MTTDTKALIEQLERRLQSEASMRNSAYDRFGMDNTPENVDPDVWKAAQTLRDLTAEVARLKALGDGLRSQIDQLADYIVNEVKANQARAKALGDGLAGYTVHEGDCELSQWAFTVDCDTSAPPCTCGLSAALTAWEKKDD